MSDIILIAALDMNYGIGKDASIPWYYPEDFKHFRKLTTGDFKESGVMNSMIMGRNTFDSIYKIKNCPLPNREHIVLTRDKDFDHSDEGVVSVHSVDDALNYVKDKETTFVIGGGQMYNLFLPYATKMELTHINKIYDCNIFFPQFKSEDWKITAIDEKDDFSFVSYVKK